jgi:hypothetical protein
MELTKIGDNFAYFENGKFDRGHIKWTELKQYENDYITTVNGKNTKGEEIREVTVAVITKGKKPDPTQVFWFVAKVLKKVLCPEFV